MGVERENGASERRSAAGAKARAADSATASGPPAFQQMLALQRTAGNRAVGALIAAAQPKLTVGAADDPYEQQADEVADEVGQALRLDHSDSAAPRAKGDGRVRRLDRRLLRRRAQPPVGERQGIGLEGGDLDAPGEAQVDALRASGSPLPTELRRSMEGAFDADFSSVRLHRGPESAQLNRSMGAAAFTVGSDIFLGAGTTSLEHESGQRLLAHELAHTLQQGGSDVHRTTVTAPTVTTTPTLARMPTKTEWITQSNIAIGPFRRDRSPELQQVDAAVDEYGAIPPDQLQNRTAKLTEIEQKINAWRAAKGKDSEESPRWPKLSALLDKVRDEQDVVKLELKRAKVVAADPTLLQDGHNSSAELFDRFMTHFRGVAHYTLKTASGSPWDNPNGTYACGTFAKAFADLAQAAGLNAKTVQITPRNFVTPAVDADFVDTGALGNVQNSGGTRLPQYFFTEHWVTEVAGQYFCPTSGKRLSGLGAPELVSSGPFQKVKEGEYGTGATTVVKRVGETADGGGLYELS